MTQEQKFQDFSDWRVSRRQSKTNLASMTPRTRLTASLQGEYLESPWIRSIDAPRINL